MAIFHCKRVNLVNGVIFGVEGGIRDKRNFDISEFELHGTECILFEGRIYFVFWVHEHRFNVILTLETNLNMCISEQFFEGFT